MAWLNWVEMLGWDLKWAIHKNSSKAPVSWNTSVKRIWLKYLQAGVQDWSKDQESFDDITVNVENSPVTKSKTSYTFFNVDSECWLNVFNNNMTRYILMQPLLNQNLFYLSIHFIYSWDLEEAQIHCRSQFYRIMDSCKEFTNFLSHCKSKNMTKLDCDKRLRNVMKDIMFWKHNRTFFDSVKNES